MFHIILTLVIIYRFHTVCLKFRVNVLICVCVRSVILIGKIQQAPVLITVGPEMPPQVDSLAVLCFLKQNNCRILYNALVHLVK